MPNKALLAVVIFAALSFAASAGMPTPVAEYLFNGDAIDTSGNGNNGTLSGSALPTFVSNRAGTPNSAIQINNTSTLPVSWVSIPDSISLNPAGGAITVSAWINVSDPNFAFTARIIGKKASFTGAGGYELAYRADTNTVEFNSSGGTNQSMTVAGSFADFQPGEWHHVVGVLSGLTGQIYVDGVLRATDTSMSALASNTQVLTIGRSSGNAASEAFIGQVDDVRIYDVLLSASEVRQLAETRTWTGAGGNTSFSTPGNWTDNIVPGPMDTVNFPAPAAATLTASNDIAGLALRRIIFDTGGYVLNGALSVPEVIYTSSLNCTMNSDLTATSEVKFVFSNSGTLTYAGNLSGASTSLRRSGTGTGILSLTATNSYGGATNVDESGRLRLKGDTGSIANSSSVNVNSNLASFEIDSSGTGVVTLNRILDTAPVNIQGTLLFTAPAGSSRSETVGAITLGANSFVSLISNHNGTAGDCELISSNLVVSGASRLYRESIGTINNLPNLRPTTVSGLSNLFVLERTTAAPVASVGNTAILDLTEGVVADPVGFTNVFQSNATTANWGTLAHWLPSGNPGSDDIIIIRSGHNMNLNLADRACKGVIFDAGTGQITGTNILSIGSSGITVNAINNPSPSILCPINFLGGSPTVLVNGTGRLNISNATTGSVSNVNVMTIKGTGEVQIELGAGGTANATALKDGSFATDIRVTETSRLRLRLPSGSTTVANDIQQRITFLDGAATDRNFVVSQGAAGLIHFTNLALGSGAVLSVDEDNLIVRASVHLQGNASLIQSNSNSDDIDLVNVTSDAPGFTLTLSGGTAQSLDTVIFGNTAANVTIDVVRCNIDWGSTGVTSGQVLNGLVRMLTPSIGSIDIITGHNGVVGTELTGSGKFLIGAGRELRGMVDEVAAGGGPLSTSLPIAVEVQAGESATLRGARGVDAGSDNGDVRFRNVRLGAGSTLRLNRSDVQRIATDIVLLGNATAISDSSGNGFVADVDDANGGFTLAVTGANQIRFIGTIKNTATIDYQSSATTDMISTLNLGNSAFAMTVNARMIHSSSGALQLKVNPGAGTFNLPMGFTGILQIETGRDGVPASFLTAATVINAADGRTVRGIVNEVATGSPALVNNIGATVNLAPAGTITLQSDRANTLNVKGWVRFSNVSPGVNTIINADSINDERLLADLILVGATTYQNNDGAAFDYVGNVSGNGVLTTTGTQQTRFVGTLSGTTDIVATGTNATAALVMQTTGAELTPQLVATLGGRTVTSQTTVPVIVSCNVGAGTIELPSTNTGLLRIDTGSNGSAPDMLTAVTVINAGNGRTVRGIVNEVATGSPALVNTINATLNLAPAGTITLQSDRAVTLNVKGWVRFNNILPGAGSILNVDSINDERLLADLFLAGATTFQNNDGAAFDFIGNVTGAGTFTVTGTQVSRIIGQLGAGIQVNASATNTLEFSDRTNELGGSNFGSMHPTAKVVLDAVGTGRLDIATGANGSNLLSSGTIEVPTNNNRTIRGLSDEIAVAPVRVNAISALVSILPGASVTIEAERGANPFALDGWSRFTNVQVGAGARVNGANGNTQRCLVDLTLLGNAEYSNTDDGTNVYIGNVTGTGVLTVLGNQNTRLIGTLSGNADVNLNSTATTLLTSGDSELGAGNTIVLGGRTLTLIGTGATQVLNDPGVGTIQHSTTGGTLELRVGVNGLLPQTLPNIVINAGGGRTVRGYVDEAATGNPALVNTITSQLNILPNETAILQTERTLTANVKSWVRFTNVRTGINSVISVDTINDERLMLDILMAGPATIQNSDAAAFDYIGNVSGSGILTTAGNQQTRFVGTLGGTTDIVATGTNATSALVMQTTGTELTPQLVATLGGRTVSSQANVPVIVNCNVGAGSINLLAGNTGLLRVDAGRTGNVPDMLTPLTVVNLANSRSVVGIVDENPLATDPVIVNTIGAVIRLAAGQTGQIDSASGIDALGSSVARFTNATLETGANLTILKGAAQTNTFVDVRLEGNATVTTGTKSGVLYVGDVSSSVGPATLTLGGIRGPKLSGSLSAGVTVLSSNTGTASDNSQTPEPGTRILSTTIGTFASAFNLNGGRLACNAGVAWIFSDVGAGVVDAQTGGILRTSGVGPHFTATQTNLEFNGGLLDLPAPAGTDLIESAGTVTAVSGLGVLTMTPTATSDVRLTAASVVTNAGASLRYNRPTVAPNRANFIVTGVPHGTPFPNVHVNAATGGSAYSTDLESGFEEGIVPPRTVNNFLVSGPATVEVGQTVVYTVTARDSGNVTVASFGGTATIAISAGATITAPESPYTYVPGAGAGGDAGVHQFSVRFDSGATAVRTLSVTSGAISANFSVQVNRGNPTINWTTPVDITYGDALSATQLNAVALNLSSQSVSGTYVYTPASGAVLNTGSGQNLSVTFTPADPTNYNGATGSVQINVLQRSLVISPNDVTRPYGSANVLTATFNSFVNGDDAGDLTGLTLVTPATPASPVGTYSVTASGATSTNYSISYANNPAVLTVNPAALTATAVDVTIREGQAIPAFTVTYSGFVLGQNAAVLETQPTLTTVATSASPVGNYPITFATAPADADGNYVVTTVVGTLRIVPLRPLANAQAITVGMNTSNPVTLTGQSFSGNPLTFTITTPPAHGSLSGSGANVIYSPNAGYVGSDSFAFTANDTLDTSFPAVVSITVKPAPTITSLPFITPNPTLAGNPVFVSGAADTGTITWTWGDGTPSGSGNTTSHIYTAPGVYIVTMVVTSPEGLVTTLTANVFVGMNLTGDTGGGTGGGATPPGVTGILVGGTGAGKAQGGTGKISCNYVRRQKTYYQGSLGALDISTALTQGQLVNVPGVLTLGTGANAALFQFSLTKTGKGKSTGLPLIEFNIKKKRFKFKAQREDLTELTEALGGPQEMGIKKGTPVTLLVPVTLQIGSNVFLAMTFQVNYQQINLGGKGKL